MQEFLSDWGYLGVFLGILSTGIPFVPIPEELPVVVGGVLVGNGSARWWVMLPVCIVAVVIGDAMLYGVGRWSGPGILNNRWIKKYVLPPARLASIEGNFRKHGIKILLFARLTPGIRAPIFVTAGITKLPLHQFVLADALYAVPGVTLLFFLGYWFTDSIIALIEEDIEYVKRIIILVVIAAVVAYFIYHFLRKPVVTGDPKEMPPLVEQVKSTLEQVTVKIMHPGKTMAAPPSGRDGQAKATEPEALAPGAQGTQGSDSAGVTK